MSADFPLVSIVIPTYNHRAYVCETIESGLNQTYPALEVIVVDDGSTDGTGEMLADRYGDRIRYVYQENAGVGAARNKGASVARGEFVHFCDADDQLLPTKVERCMAVFRAKPAVALVYTQCHYVEADGKTIIPREQTPLPAGDVFCELLNGDRGNFVPQCTPLIRREAFREAGEFNEQLKSVEDWDMWLRIAARHEFGVVDEPLALYRILPNAMHTNPVRMRQARLEVFRMARDYPGRERCLSDTEYNALEAGRNHALAMALWEDGQRQAARQHLKRAMQLHSDGAASRRLLIGLSYLLPAQQAETLMRKVRSLRHHLS